MKNRRRYFSFIFLATLAGCVDHEIDTKQVAATQNQDIYFEVSYTNSAWGKNRYEGFVVDQDGRIRTYENPASWHKPIDNQTSLTSAEIKENLKETTLTDVQISATALKSYVDKIPSITTTEFSKRVPNGNDMGQTKFYAYRFDTKAGTYTPILLNETGDWKMQNKDKTAIEISTWLETLQTEVK